MKSSTFRTAAISAFMIACASNPQPATVASEPTFAAVRPASVGDVALTDSVKYPDPKMGVLYRYRKEDFRPDVYVYDKLDWSDPQGQSRGFIETLNIYERERRIDSYRMLLDQSFNLESGGRVLPAHELVFKMTSRNVVRDSYFAVVSLPTQYVKFRITEPEDPSVVVRAREFVRGWVDGYMSNRK